MVKSDGLNKVGDKKLIFQNDRLATATQEIKKTAEKSTNRISKNTNTHKYPNTGWGRRPPGGAKGPQPGPKAPGQGRRHTKITFLYLKELR